MRSARSSSPSSPPRGLMSTLRLKQDLVRYLLEDDAENEQGGGRSSARPGGDSDHGDSSDVAEDHEAVAARSSRPKTALRMPPIDSAAARTGGGTRNGRPQPAGTTTSSSSLSPKELLVEQLYQRYPRLLLDDTHQDRKGVPASTVVNGDSAELDQEQEEDEPPQDVRFDHPVLRAINVSSSDMDLVFVGTASCTPGTTRGVSCTALRINGRRVSHPGGGMAVAKPNSSSKKAGSGPPHNYFQQQTFRGGTWLFDVGECTQVRSSP